MDLTARNRPQLHKWGVRALVVLGVVGAFFLLRHTVFAPDPIPVRTTRVEIGMVESSVTNSKAGTIKARQRSHISAEIGGRIVEINHREGEVVSKDSVLVRLSDASFRAQETLSGEAIEVAKARYKEACIIKDRAKRELERKRKLAAENIVSEDQLDQLEHNYEAAMAICSAAESELKKSRAALGVTKADLEKVVIRAPFDGVIAEVSAEVGEWVTPSSQGIVDLINPASLYISAPMDEIDSGRIRLGSSAKVTIDSRPGESFPGKVTRIAPYVLDIEAQNRTVEIEVELDDADVSSSLLPGTSADVEVILLAKPDVLRIPTSALYKNSRVLILDDGVLAEHEIETGLRNWDYVEIVKGLSEGDEVVTSLDRAEVEAGARAEVIEPEKEPDGDS